MPEQSRDKLKIFISYSRNEAMVADGIVARLEARGFEVRIDHRDLPYGQRWQDELSEFIRSADTVVWLVSPGSIGSRWCNWELGEVIRLKKRLVPVALEPISPELLPPAIGEIQLLPSVGPFSIEEHEDALVEALKLDGAWLKQGTRLAEAARQWTDRGRNRALLLRGAGLKDAEAWLARQPEAAPPPGGELLEMILASKQATTSRLGWTVACAVLIAVCGLALAVTASVQRQRAERAAQEAKTQSTRATRAVEIAGGTASALVTDLARDFRDRAVPLPVTRRILERARKVIEELAAGGEGSARLMIDRASALTELSGTYLRSDLAAEATEAANGAIAALKSLSTANEPLEPERLGGLSRAYEALGDVMSALGQFQQARDLYQQGIDVEEDELKRVDSRAQMLFFKLARSHGDLGDRPGAEERYRSVIAMESRRKALVADDEISEVAVIARGALADLLVKDERVDDALVIYQEIKSGLERWIEEDKEIVESRNRSDLRSNLVTVLDRIGDAYLGKKAFGQALEMFKEALRVSKILADQHPDRSDFQYGVTSAYYHYAKAMTAARQPNQAIANYQLAIRLAEQNHAEEKANRKWRLLLAQIVGDFGDVFWVDESWSRAVQQYRSAVGLLLEFLADDPADVEFRGYLVRYYLRLNELDPADGRHLEAAVNLMRALDKDGNLSAEGRQTLDRMETALADPHRNATNRTEEASELKKLHEAIKVADAAHDTFGGNRMRADYSKIMAEMFAGIETYTYNKPAAMTAEMLDIRAWYLLASGRPAIALTESEKAVAAAPHLIRLKATQAFALLLLGRSSDALQFIRANRGALIDHAGSWSGQVDIKDEGPSPLRNLARELGADARWEQLIALMLAELRVAGVDAAVLQEAERALAE